MREFQTPNIYFRAGDPHDPRFRYEVVNAPAGLVYDIGHATHSSWPSVARALEQAHSVLDGRTTYVPGLLKDQYPPFMERLAREIQTLIGEDPKEGVHAWLDGVPVFVTREIPDDLSPGEEGYTRPVYNLGNRAYLSIIRLVEGYFHPEYTSEVRVIPGPASEAN